VRAMVTECGLDDQVAVRRTAPVRGTSVKRQPHSADTARCAGATARERRSNCRPVGPLLFGLDIIARGCSPRSVHNGPGGAAVPGRVPRGCGKPVQIRREPVAVTGDELRTMPLAEIPIGPASAVSRSPDGRWEGSQTRLIREPEDRPSSGFTTLRCREGRARKPWIPIPAVPSARTRAIRLDGPRPCPASSAPRCS
jgi:hypothetical protein